MGGVGGGIAYNIEEFRELAGPRPRVLPGARDPHEESIIGWKELSSR
jgi:carbamoylphosphate synthase large subunit